MNGVSPPNGLVEHFFRHAYARVVATLVRRVGLAHLQQVEDAVQSALETALSVWTEKGVPRDPDAWLFQVAWRNVLATLRGQRAHHATLAREGADASVDPPSGPLESEVRDELLRMIFVSCEERVPPESRLVFVLKILCGFGTKEIAARLFISEANVHKRLQRARDQLADLPSDLDVPLERLCPRLSSVQGVIYLLFTEGYLSTNTDQAIRTELCAEAIRLATALAEHAIGSEPSSFALLALMHLPAARLSARQDATGGLLLLEEQDRASWSSDHLAMGVQWLTRAGQGSTVTRFHVEAAIAAEHALAPSVEATNWRSIASLYEMLESLDPSPLHTLNRAVAIAQVDGPQVGLALVEAVVPPAWLDGYFLWDAVLADLHARAGNAERAERHRQRALTEAPSERIREALARRLRA